MTSLTRILVLALLFTALFTLSADAKRRTPQQPKPPAPAPAPAPTAPAPAPASNPAPAPAPAPTAPAPAPAPAEKPAPPAPAPSQKANPATREAVKVDAIEVAVAAVPEVGDAPKRPENLETDLFAFRSKKGEVVVGASDAGAVTASSLYTTGDAVVGGSIAATAFHGAGVSAENIVAGTVGASSGTFSGSLGAQSIKVEEAVVAQTVQAGSLTLNGEDLSSTVQALASRLEAAEEQLEAKTKKIEELEEVLQKLPNLTKKVAAVIKILSKFDLKSDFEKIDGEEL